MIRIYLIISGDVQGVGFRSWVRRQALALHLTGWVKNQPDGAVEIVAEGSPEKLGKFMEICRSGPETSWVENVTVDQEEATGEFTGFNVVY